ncbi:hypothetical protein LJR129_003592 [Acidovorax sp. LjRoot129]|uniref:hypothetical protein n=1 Tax=Acidovorax sp. LjRoot129 TaxID=3342260 RepID=UPI003ECCC18F
MDSHTDEVIARVKSAFASIHCQRDLAEFVESHHLSRAPVAEENTEELYSGTFCGLQVSVTATTMVMDYMAAPGLRCHVMALQLRGPGEQFNRPEVVLRFDES